MAAPRARRINVPLRHLAVLCGVLLFVLLGTVTRIQVLDAGRLKENPHNQRPLFARFDRPRGDPAPRRHGRGDRRRGRGEFRHRRVYPGGAVYAPVTGHLSRYGATGLERARDAVLSGTDSRVMVRSIMAATGAGATVGLTIDGKAQRAAYEALRATGRPGAAVAIDPATGAILAMASFLLRPQPVHVLRRGDPGPGRRAPAGRSRQAAAQPGDPAELSARVRLQGHHWGRRARLGRLRTGRDRQRARRLPPAGHLRAPAQRPGSSCGDGEPPLAYAFKTSCNTPFAMIGVELGQEALREQAEAFGFNDGGLTVPMPVAESVYPAGMDPAQTAMSALGQFDDRVTPLMLAMISSAVANGGSLMRPHLVREIRLDDGTVIDETEPSQYRRALDAGDALRLAAMMVAVTQPGGTGTAAAIPGIEVAAKTGTAENAEGEADHAVFTGFAPAGSPGGGGGRRGGRRVRRPGRGARGEGDHSGRPAVTARAGRSVWTPVRAVLRWPPAGRPEAAHARIPAPGPERGRRIMTA
nr:penicillin-binding transpeptidase domain-containing protein [Planobispora longispora]